MIVAKRMMSQASLNWFGLSDHFSFPALVFIIMGKIGEILGGINLANMRLVHASFGLISILMSYFLFRSFFSQFWALAAAIILGVSHSLIGISRMILWNNSALLMEITALGLLCYGFKKKKLLFCFLGSLAAGLTLYVYFPARVTIIIWFLFLLGSTFILKGISRKFVLKTISISLLCFILIAGPIIIATINTPSEKFSYEKQQQLIFEEGRQMQKSWIGASTEAEGIKTNMINGLTVFNSTKSDYAYIYPNPGHGFVDPLTGVLVWVGVILVISKSIIKRKFETFDLFNLIGLLTLIFFFSFITNKTPNYPRLLIILPFAVYFVVRGISLGLELLKGSNFTKYTVLITLASLIWIWNLVIFNNFIQKGLKEGNDIGSTARYVEIRKNIPGYSFYLLANSQYPYYSWGNKSQWETWLGFFVGTNQHFEILPPENFTDQILQKPFTVFMSNPLWSKSKLAFIEKYPNFQAQIIKPDGSLVAIEVNH